MLQKIMDHCTLFDTRPCEIDDLAVSSHQMAPLPGNLRHIFEKIHQLKIGYKIFNL